MWVDNQNGGGIKMHECLLCGYIYDEEAEGVMFGDLEEEYKCPLCSAGKAAFRPFSGVSG